MSGTVVETGDAALHLNFRPRARILQLLGDELIGSPRLAVFELVKNAYDADAETVRVVLNNIDRVDASIVVEDDGDGMTLETIRDIWLVPGHDHRARQRKASKRTRLNRLPLGEKGVGRFAAHKLGNRIELITRATEGPERVVSIDWAALTRHQDLSDAVVHVGARDPVVFVRTRTGTQITISDLREKVWTRDEVRRLQREIASMASPFAGRSDRFQATLEAPGHEAWVADPPDVNALLQRAPWRFRFSFAAGRFDWTYSFRGITGIDLESRDFEKTDEPLLMPQERELDEFGVERGDGRSQPCRVRADASTAEGIGPVEGRFYVFDRDLNVLRRLGESQSIRHYLDANGGIRVYRDGIRVYNYGEPGDDWLGTDLGRGERPTRSLSRNVVIGAVDLSLAASGGLVERTNREGFVENPTFRRLRRIVTGALMPLHVEHDRDKTKMRRRATSIRNAGTGHDTRPLQELRALACRHNLSDDLEPLVDAAEPDYDEFRNSMLRTALSGMSLAVIFHEVQHGVRTLCDLVEKGDDPSAARTSARELARALEGYADLLRKGARRPYSLNRLIRRARDINRVRFRKHRVRLDCPALDVGVPDVTSSFVFGLALGALNNLLDNAFYWLRVRWPDEDAGLPGRAIHISTNLDLAEGPAIVVADTGPGFMDEPEEMTRPFFSRRPEGMGVGLYYANLVMELGGGRLVFPDARQARVPHEFGGAVLALVFPETKQA